MTRALPRGRSFTSKAARQLALASWEGLNAPDDGAFCHHSFGNSISWRPATEGPATHTQNRMRRQVCVRAYAC